MTCGQAVEICRTRWTHPLNHIYVIIAQGIPLGNLVTTNMCRVLGRFTLFPNPQHLLSLTLCIYPLWGKGPHCEISM